MASDARLEASAATRNREPILNILWRHLPSRGVILEVASGTGEHITYFAEALSSDLRLQPSDLTPGPAPAQTLGLLGRASAIFSRRSHSTLQRTTGQFSRPTE